MEDGVAAAEPSREASKRLRAELVQGLGYYPASLASEDVARYREQIAERKAREEAGEREWYWWSGRIPNVRYSPFPRS
jgi:hypothetical protein